MNNKAPILEASCCVLRCLAFLMSGCSLLHRGPTAWSRNGNAVAFPVLALSRAGCCQKRFSCPWSWDWILQLIKTKCMRPIASANSATPKKQSSQQSSQTRLRSGPVGPVWCSAPSRSRIEHFAETPDPRRDCARCLRTRSRPQHWAVGCPFARRLANLLMWGRSTPALGACRHL